MYLPPKITETRFISTAQESKQNMNSQIFEHLRRWMKLRQLQAVKNIQDSLIDQKVLIFPLLNIWEKSITRKLIIPLFHFFTWHHLPWNTESNRLNYNPNPWWMQNSNVQCHKYSPLLFLWFLQNVSWPQNLMPPFVLFYLHSFSVLSPAGLWLRPAQE